MHVKPQVYSKVSQVYVQYMICSVQCIHKNCWPWWAEAALSLLLVCMPFVSSTRSTPVQSLHVYECVVLTSCLKICLIKAESWLCAVLSFPYIDCLLPAQQLHGSGAVLCHILQVSCSPPPFCWFVFFKPCVCRSASSRLLPECVCVCLLGGGDHCLIDLQNCSAVSG